jgi:hypothetical protein
MISVDLEETGHGFLRSVLAKTGRCRGEATCERGGCGKSWGAAGGGRSAHFPWRCNLLRFGESGLTGADMASVNVIGFSGRPGITAVFFSLIAAFMLFLVKREYKNKKRGCDPF